MSMFKKAINATTGAVKNITGGDKDKDGTRGSTKVYAKKDKKVEIHDEDDDPFHEYESSVDRKEPVPAQRATMEDEIDQSVLDMLDELQDDTPSTPVTPSTPKERTSHARSPSSNVTVSPATPSPAPRPAASSTTPRESSVAPSSGMVKSPSSGNLSDNSINSPSRSTPVLAPKPAPSPAASPQPAPQVLRPSVAQTSAASAPQPSPTPQAVRPSVMMQQAIFVPPPRPPPPAKKIPVGPKSTKHEPNELGPVKFGFNIITTIPLTPRWVTYIIAIFFPRTGTKIVLRRYKHIEDLHTQLLDYYEEVPQLPMFLSMDADKASTVHIDDHRIRLQAYLNAIGELPSLVNQHPIISFIGGAIKDPKLQTRPRFGDFADEDVEDKLRRDLCEWKIQENIDQFVHINTALGKLLSFEVALLKVRVKSDWVFLSDAARSIAMVGKMLEEQLPEPRFVPKHISAEQAEAITEFRLRNIVDSTLAAISEITSKLRRIWCLQLDPVIDASKLTELRNLASKINDAFYIYSIIAPMNGFKIEYGTPDFSWKSWPSYFSQNSPWFHDYFFNRPHINLLATHPQYGSMVISFMAQETDDKYSYFRAIIRSERGNVKHVMGARGREQVEWQNNISTIRDVLERMEPYTKAITDISVAKDEMISDELLVFESRDMRVTPHFKIGVLYCAQGQTTEEQMFSNSEGTQDYENFLDLIGDKITLAGWNRYNGGLDIKGPNTTGTHSYFTTFSGYDIMYHVSTMFPFSTEGGAQQVHKKRHLGNDIIMVVFQDEGADDYLPNCVRSQYIQVVIVVRKLPSPPDSNEVFYKVSVVRNADVPTFGPPLPYPAVMKHGPEFRSWLLYKIVNGELASYRSPLFIKQLAAGFRSQCETLYEKYYRPQSETSAVDAASDGMRKGIKVAGKAVSGLGKGVGKLMGGGKKDKERDEKRDSYNQ